MRLPLGRLAAPLAHASLTVVCPLPYQAKKRDAEQLLLNRRVLEEREGAMWAAHWARVMPVRLLRDTAPQTTALLQGADVDVAGRLHDLFVGWREHGQ